MSTATRTPQVRINEIFHSIQGEGAFAGTPTTFIRFQGCSVGCSWCDTKYTWDFAGGTPFTIGEVLAQLRYPHVVLTGGEPVQQPRSAMQPLVEALQAKGHHLQLETSGRFYAPWVDAVDWVTVSPKPPSYAIRPELLARVDELKYVVDEAFELERVLPDELPPTSKLYLQPEGNKPHLTQRTLALLAEHPHWRLSLQLHKLLGLQ